MERVTTFKYLVSTLAENGDLDAKITHRKQSGWEKLEEGIADSVRSTNKLEGQVESVHNDCKTSNYVRCRDMGSEVNTLYGGNV